MKTNLLTLYQTVTKDLKPYMKGSPKLRLLINKAISEAFKLGLKQGEKNVIQDLL